MDMTVHKRWNQCPLPGGHALRRHTAGRQLVPAVKAKMDKEYRIWKAGTILVTVIALGIYIIPVLF